MRKLWLFVVFVLLCACHAPSRHSAPDILELPATALVVPPEAATFQAFLTAELQGNAGDLQGAVVSLQQAVASAPHEPFLRLSLIETLLKSGAEEEALRLAEEGQQRFLTMPEFPLFLGNYHFNHSDYARAIGYFEQAYALDSQPEGVALHLAVALSRGGDQARAVKVLQELVARESEAVGARLILARLYREMEQPQQAEEILRGLLRSHPDLDTPALELGSLLEARNLPKAALVEYREALRRNPGNAAVRHHVARLLVLAGDLDGALMELDIVVRQNPDDLEARRKIGLIYLEQRLYGKAIDTFNALLEADPQLTEVRFYLGSAYERQGLFGEALSQFELIPEASELYVDALTHRAFLLDKLQRGEAAITLLETTITRPDARLELFFYLAGRHEAREDWSAAQAVLVQAGERFPDAAEVPYRLGLLYERQKRMDEAVASMRRVLVLDPDHAEALNFIAYSFAESGTNLDEALTLAQRAARLKPDGHVLDTLGWVWFRLGNLGQARENLEAAVGKTGDDPVVLEHLGDVLRALKLYQKAAENYRRALEVNPDNSTLREKLDALPGGLKR